MREDGQFGGLKEERRPEVVRLDPSVGSTGGPPSTEGSTGVSTPRVRDHNTAAHHLDTFYFPFYGIQEHSKTTLDITICRCCFTILFA